MNDKNGSKPTLRVVGLGGTLRGNSFSRRALEIALEAVDRQGAATELLALDDLDLPFFRPGTRLQDYPQSVEKLIETSRRADAMLWSTGAYHGTLAGATKNALDFFEFLADDGYLDGIPVGLIATSGGHMAGVSALDAMVHTAHALRATVLPLKVPIGKVRQAFSSEGELLDNSVERRLNMLARLVVRQSAKFALEPVAAG